MYKEESGEFVDVTFDSVEERSYRDKRTYGRIKFGGKYTVYAFREKHHVNNSRGRDWFRASCDDEYIEIEIDSVDGWDRKIAVSIVYYNQVIGGEDSIRYQSKYFGIREEGAFRIPLSEIKAGYDVNCTDSVECRFDIRIKDELSGKYFAYAHAPVSLDGSGNIGSVRAPQPPTGVVIPP
ncbi:MAG: hypothetical protein Rubg2KO_06910 [Rubricoccaceae bacterium]